MKRLFHFSIRYSLLFNWLDQLFQHPKTIIAFISSQFMGSSSMANFWTRCWRRYRIGALTRNVMLSGLALWLTCIPVDTTHAVAQPTEWHRATIHGHWIYYTVRGRGPTLPGGAG